jgi:hypothetical protein
MGHDVFCMCCLLLDTFGNGIWSSYGFSWKAFVLLEMSGSSVHSSPCLECVSRLFFSFLMFRSLEACGRLCLHCGNQAAFWNQSELRIELLLCVEFGVHYECSGFPQLCHLFEL